MHGSGVALPVAATASGATYVLDAERSVLEEHTDKAGLFGGHRYLVRAMQLSGEVEADPKAPGGARMKMEVPTASLKVLDPDFSEKDSPLPGREFDHF